MSRDDEAFLARWSRLKTAGGDATTPPAPRAAPAAVPQPNPLPDPDTLTFDADFSAFLGQEVAESLKCRALKKLFHSLEFNVMDGLDVYIDDYSRPDPVSEELLKNLAHAHATLFAPPPAAEPAALAVAVEEETRDC